jgi:POT family proton-dependent oligopeptide transporter
MARKTGHDGPQMKRIAAGPDGLASLCLSVGFERAAYYGLQSILALYLASILLDDRSASVVWLLPELARLSGTQGVVLASMITGLFLSLAAIAPAIGGIISDRVTGQHRAIMIGGVMMAAGHGLLIVEAALLPALAVIALGSGFFKGPVAAQLSRLYHPDDDARVEGFRLFYVAINVAGLLAPLVIGTVAERIHWHAGFAVSCLTMMIGLAIYWQRFADTIVGIAPLADTHQQPSVRVSTDRLTLVILGASIAMVTIANFQITNAYLLWADLGFDRSMGGWEFPASWMIAADGLLSLLALVASGIFWREYERQRGPIEAAAKAVIGGALVAAGTACLVIAGSLHGRTGVPVFWGLAFQLLNSFGLANVLPAVMAMFGQSSSSRFTATAMAGFYLSMFAGGMISTALASQFTVLTPVSFWLVHSGCATIGMLGLAVVLYRARSDRATEGKVVKA